MFSFCMFFLPRHMYYVYECVLYRKLVDYSRLCSASCSYACCDVRSIFLFSWVKLYILLPLSAKRGDIRNGS